MIEVISAYTGTARAEGKVKITAVPAYRCTVCELIKTNLAEIKQHNCIEEIEHGKRKSRNSTQR